MQDVGGETTGLENGRERPDPVEVGSDLNDRVQNILPVPADIPATDQLPSVRPTQGSVDDQ